MNLYETTTLIKAIEQSLPVHSFLKNTFFPRKKELLTSKVLIDTKRGNRKMAPFVAPRIGGVTIDREGFMTSSVEAPKIAPQRVLTVDDLETRAFGENLYSTKTPAQREQGIIANDLDDFDKMITRREEKMIRDLLFTGKIVIKGYVDVANEETVDAEINYGQVKEFTPTVKWNATGADKPTILKDLRKWRREITKANGKAPNMVVMSSDVVDILLGDEELKKLLDNRNISIGKIEPKVGDAVTFIGNLPGLGMSLYSYDEWYLDEETDEDVAMVPEGTILLANSDIGEIRYGLITQIEEGSKNFVSHYSSSRVPKIWTDVANDRKMIRLSSAPVPVPDNLDSWGVAKVI